MVRQRDLFPMSSSAALAASTSDGWWSSSTRLYIAVVVLLLLWILALILVSFAWHTEHCMRKVKKNCVR